MAERPDVEGLRKIGLAHLHMEAGSAVVALCDHAKRVEGDLDKALSRVTKLETFIRDEVLRELEAHNEYRGPEGAEANIRTMLGMPEESEPTEEPEIWYPHLECHPSNWPPYSDRITMAKVEHLDVRVLITRSLCESLDPNCPDEFWFICWYALLEGVEYGEADEIQRPCSDDDIAESARKLEASAKEIIDEWKSAMS